MTNRASRFACLLSATALAAPAAACPHYDTVVAAVQADDTTSAELLYEEIVFSAACDDAIREWVGDYLARERFLQARASDEPETGRALLREALQYERHWRSLAELGRLDWQDGEYAAASVLLQEAINEIAEGDQAHAASEAEIAELYELATAALALADAPVEMPRTRSGTLGGVFTMSIRGFTVEEVSLPITFAYDSTEFDEIGSDYAEALVEHVTLTAPAAIYLGGHTDPTGGEAYNLELSTARAERVEALLRENGLEGVIGASGYGETQVPEAPPGIEPGSDEHHRLARRVAFSVE